MTKGNRTDFIEAVLARITEKKVEALPRLLQKRYSDVTKKTGTAMLGV